MFFSISTEKFDDRFLNHKKINNFYISLDSGWKQTLIDDKFVFYKGYADNNNLENILPRLVLNPEPRHDGNFSAIIIGDSDLVLTHDNTRSFPLNIDQNKFITNLTKQNSVKPIWTDCYIKINGTEIEYNFFDLHKNLNLDFEKSLTLNQCAKEIKKIIDEKINFIINNKLPKRIFLSGGLDTTLLYAISKNYFDNVEIINHEHIDYNKFLLKNYSQLRNEYAVYNQMHCYRENNILFSGAPGDEYFMRGPYVASIWAAWQNINIDAELKNYKQCYHYQHFNKEKNIAGFKQKYNNRQEIKQSFLSYKNLCAEIINICANDHQMWHLNNTITWTPFKDLRILSAVLKLNKKDLLSQVLDGTLSRRVISLYDSEAVDLVDDFKNHKSFEKIISNPKLSTFFE